MRFLKRSARSGDDQNEPRNCHARNIVWNRDVMLPGDTDPLFWWRRRGVGNLAKQPNNHTGWCGFDSLGHHTSLQERTVTGCCAAAVN